MTAARANPVLDPDEFYILVSREAVHVPRFMRRNDAVRSAGWRIRFIGAGFFDPFRA